MAKQNNEVSKALTHAEVGTYSFLYFPFLLILVSTHDLRTL
jgi:hypothetical protein